MELGNLMFRLGLDTKDFDDKLKNEAAAAKKLADDVAKAFANLKIPALTGDAARNAKLAAQAQEALAKAALATAKAQAVQQRASGAAAMTDERRLQAINQLTAQMNKLAEAENKVRFAQTNRGAAGPQTDLAIRNIRLAMQGLDYYKSQLQSGMDFPRSTLQVAMEQGIRATRQATVAISEQKTLNEAADRAKLASQAAITNALAVNERSLRRINSQYSLSKRILGELKSYVGMYFSVYAAQNFLQSLVRIRGEFELQYTALKAILQSGQQANEIFSQLKSLAPISPYQFKDLATYAKQLSAYSIPYNELFDTTKRLADLSSGLGVDFYRIVLAYGQVRSAAFLRGQELRQFTEAGIPMVDELAKKFTKLKGEVVSSGDVFNLISERQVPFKMVKEVIDDLTKEGGKFYMMQEKQAETLKGKVSNLGDRYDIMMNSIGEKNDKVLKGFVDGLSLIMENANLLLNVITKLGMVWGLWRVGVMASTTAMTKSVAASTSEEARSRVRQANLLKEAQLYRQLTSEEVKALQMRGLNVGQTGMFSAIPRSRMKLSSMELGELYQKRIVGANGTINTVAQNEALRLAYIGRINTATLESLKNAGAITEDQMKQVVSAREHVRLLGIRVKSEGAINTAIKARIVMMRLGSSLMGALGSIFNPTTLLIGGITAGLTALENYRQHQEELRKQAEQIAENAKEQYEDVRRFIADNPIELVVKDADPSMLSELRKRYIEEIQKAVPKPLSNDLVSSIYFDEESGKERSLVEQVKRAKEIAEATAEAAKLQSKYNNLLIQAAEEHDGLFNDSLPTNLKEAAVEYDEFQSALMKLDKAKMSNAVDNFHVDQLGESGKILAAQLKDGKSSAEAIYTTFKKILDETSKGKHPNFNSGMFITASGIQDILDQDEGGFMVKGYRPAADTMLEQAKNVAEDFKKRMVEAGIKPMSDAGRIYAEQMKSAFYQNADVSNEHIRDLFNFQFDSVFNGEQAAAFKILGEELAGNLSDGAKEAYQAYMNGGPWTPALDKAIEEAKAHAIAKFPELKGQLEKAWKTPSEPEFRIQINTAIARVELEAWQKNLIQILGKRYEAVITASANIKEAQDAVQQMYDNARAFITKQKPLLLKLGITGDSKSLQAWLSKYQYVYKDQAIVSLVKALLGEAQTVDDAKDAIAKGIINPSKSDRKDRPKKTRNEKDEFTERIKKWYDSRKKALEEYKKLREYMSTELAKQTVIKNHKDEIKDLSDSWLDPINGGINLLEEAISKLGKRATSAAKEARRTWRDSIAALKDDKDLHPFKAYDEQLGKEMDNIEKRFKTYNDFFKTSGRASISATIAFGDNTKPYNDYLAYLKTKLREAQERAAPKNGGTKIMTFEEMLGLSDEDKSRLTKSVKEVFDKINKYIADGKDTAIASLKEIFSKTSDEDLKIEINNSNRNELLEKIRTSLFPVKLDENKNDVNAAKRMNMENQVNDYYNRLNKELSLSKLKKSLNWDELFGDLGALSYPQLEMMQRQLEIIIRSNNDIDPTKMKEWADRLRKVNEEMSKLKPYMGLFKGLMEVRDARIKRNNIADTIGSMRVTQQYNKAIERGDTKEMERLKKTTVELNGKSMTYAEALDELTKATREYKDAQSKNNPSKWVTNAMGKMFGKKDENGNRDIEGFAEDLANFSSLIDLISTNLQSLDKFRKDLGIGDNTVVGIATSSLATLSSGVSGVLKSLESGDLFGAIDGVFNTFYETGQKIFGTANYDALNASLEHSKNMIDIWTDALQRSTDKLEEASTEERIKVAESAKKSVEAIRTQAITDAKNVFSAGASLGSHSIGARYNKGGYGDWSSKYAEIEQGLKNAKLGTDRNGDTVHLNSIQDLLNLTGEQLQWVKENYADLWAQHDSNVRTALETIIEADDKAKQLDKTLKQLWTQTTTENITSGFASALDSMEDQTKTFSNNFTKILRTAVINAFMQSDAIQKAITAWYEKLYGFMKNDEKGPDGSELSDREVNELQTDWGKIGDSVSNFQDALKRLGLYADQTVSGLSGGIKSITEETADLLASYVNAIRADVAFIRTWYVAHFNDNNKDDGMSDVVTQISVTVAQIEVNTRNSAVNTDKIYSLLNSLTKTVQQGKALRVS